MSTEQYPLYPMAVILPALALPAVLLDIPPMIWHFSQQNIAAGSLMAWVTLLNLMCFINPIIWPRDNMDDWWDGNVFCDVQARIQVGAVVALASCTAMIMRRLARVMDTRNITVVPSRNTRVREKSLEILWCWGYPIFMMVVYYIVQPVRYFIFGISGCYFAYDSSWPSLVLSYMWNPITMCFATYYASLLTYRLHRYRKEFHRLIAARNTTKSRFMRLFVMACILIVFYLPWVFYNMYTLIAQIVDAYSWSRVHGPDWNSVVKVPGNGVVRTDKWSVIATGYVAFFVFGTGSDANNTYKRMLCAIGLGNIFPSIYNMSKSGSSTPSSNSFAKGWCSTMSTKARSLFSKADSATETSRTGTDSRTSSIAFMSTPTTARTDSLHLESTAEPIAKEASLESRRSTRSFFTRIFSRCNYQHPVLPLFSRKSIEEINQPEKSAAYTAPTYFSARAWSSERPTMPLAEETQGVYVIREVHQEQHQKNAKEMMKEKELGNVLA